MARSGFEFTPDEDGIERVLEGPGVADLLTTTAEEAASKMRAIAPRGFLDFKKKITAIPAKKTGREIAAHAGSSSPGWHLQEYGTHQQRPRATLRRAMKMVGIRFEEGR